MNQDIFRCYMLRTYCAAALYIIVLILICIIIRSCGVSNPDLCISDVDVDVTFFDFDSD